MTPPSTIRIAYVDGEWVAASSLSWQGHVSGSHEVVLATVAAWMRGEAG